MIQLAIPLSEQDVEKLKEHAKHRGLSIEELLVAAAQDLLSRSDDEFQRAMEYVLNKNENLYARLAE